MKILKFKIKTYKNSILQEGKCPLPNLPDQVLGAYAFTWSKKCDSNNVETSGTIGVPITVIKHKLPCLIFIKDRQKRW